MERNIVKFLDSISYEMEYNVTAFDWLRMYGKVLGNIDFNVLIENHHKMVQMTKAREKQSDNDILEGKMPKFEYIKPTHLLKSEKEWLEIKEYCEFVADFFKAQKQAVSD